MSTNPFRRSSLKGFNGSGGDAGGSSNGLTASSSDISRPNTDATTSLSVNTKVPTSTQKHVNFASPPAIPISPVSYPPSPESTRFSPAFQNARPILPFPTDYSGAIQNDPFRAEAKTNEDDGEIAQALVNAKINATLAAPSLETTREDAVRDTLSRFASAPKRHATAIGDDVQPAQASIPQRQTMDVDAFKRLLLTGDTGDSLHKPEVPRAIATGVGDGSSGTDTASVSQGSLFGPVSTVDISSESSNDAETNDMHAVRRAAITLSENMETRKKPLPPKPRHGKLFDENSMKESATTAMSPLAVLTQGSTDLFLVPSGTKTAPTPPLARRNHNNINARPPSSRTSSSSDIAAPANANDTNSKAPHPPRARRPNTVAERRPSGDLPPTQEESDYTDSSVLSSRKASETRPPPPPSRNSSKRVSTGLINPPPVPPPRRGRGSSRSSIESQRPSMSNFINNESAGNSNTDSAHTTLVNSNANDILADLAALQREVDEARSKGTK